MLKINCSKCSTSSSVSDINNLILNDGDTVVIVCPKCQNQLLVKIGSVPNDDEQPISSCSSSTGCEGCNGCSEEESSVCDDDYAYKDEECHCDCTTCEYRDDEECDSHCDYEDDEDFVENMLQTIHAIRSALIARNPEDALNVAMMSDADCIDEVVNDYHLIVTTDIETGKPNTRYAILKEHLKSAIKLNL